VAQTPDFSSLSATIIGISGDSPAENKGFKEKNKLTYTLLSDTKREARKAYEVQTNPLLYPDSHAKLSLLKVGKSFLGLSEGEEILLSAVGAL
jgi:AhpC/TSA family